MDERTLSDKNEPVYRPHVVGSMDEGTRRLVLIASGIGLFLLVVVGGWSLGGRHGVGAGEIPVIGPDPGPIKIKPANPGGLQLTGAEPPPANDDNGGGPSLAPGPEKPDPAALQAELDAARHADAPPAAPATSPKPATSSAPAAPATPATAETQAASATKPAPVTAAAPVASPPVPVPPAARPAAVGSPSPATVAAPPSSSLRTALASLRAAPPAAGIAVQLAAVDTAAEAHAQWDHLAHAHPGLLGERAPLVLPAARHDGKTFYRLRTGGFATVAAATAFCAQLRAAGAACTIATF